MTTTSSSPIPVITLADTPECAASLLEAARTLGFVYIRSADVPKASIDSVFAIVRSGRSWYPTTQFVWIHFDSVSKAKQFFALPSAAKDPFRITASNHGYSALHSELLDPTTQARGDFKQAFNIAEPALTKNTPLPPLLETHDTELLAFRAQCHALCQRVLALFALAFELDDTYFWNAHDSPAQGNSGSILRMLYYPPTGDEFGEQKGDIRAGAHSDYGSVTLLFQEPSDDSGSLELLMPDGGGWRKVPVIEDAVCVNIGDLMSFWTQGVLKSTVHRVVGNKERWSVAYFCHPVDETLLEGIPSPVVKKYGREAGKMGVMTAREHLEGRLRATYGWGKNDEEKTAGE